MQIKIEKKEYFTKTVLGSELNSIQQKDDYLKGNLIRKLFRNPFKKNK